MAKYVLTNSKIFVDDYNISGDTNAGTLAIETAILDDTTFGNTTRTKALGLDDVKASLSVLYDNTTAYVPDDEIATWKTGRVAKVVTICPTTGADGEVSYCFKGLNANYTAGGSVGELRKGTWDIEGSGGTGSIIRGTVFKNATSGIAAGGNGTAYGLGLLGTGHTLYSVFHVYSITGGTLYVSVYSDDNEAFTSTTARLASSAITETGAYWLTLAGPIADDTWWRCQYAYTGTLAKFLHTVVII